MTMQFDLGLWNAWLGALPLYLAGFVIPLFGHREAIRRMLDFSWYDERDRRVCAWCMLFFWGYLLCSLVAPLKTGTPLFYAGMILYMISFICLLAAYVNYASTPLDQPIVAGVYRFSRNPQYFFTTTGLTGLSLAAGSWPLLLLVILFTWLQHLLVRSEEKYCLATYGDAYRRYLQSVPRYLLLRTR